MPLAFDPLVSISFLFFQIGSRYLKIDVTKAQAKILSHPYVQGILYISIVYYSTRNIENTIIIFVMSYILVNILLNENSQYNILPSKLLYEENLSDILVSYRENYKTNFEKYHS
jgi:hypothetical protein